MIDIIQATYKNPYELELDPVGYFKIQVSNEDNCIYADYYNYEKERLKSIKGTCARAIYWTIIDREWISSLSHAAYLGKELMRAEYALVHHLPYEQE